MQNNTLSKNVDGTITTEFHGTIRGLVINNSSVVLMIIELHGGKTLVHIAQKIDILTAMSSEDEYLSDLSATDLGSNFIRQLLGKLVLIIIDHFPYEEKVGNSLIVLGNHAHAYPRQILLSGSENEDDIFF